MIFPETRWTVLAEVTLSGDKKGRNAFNELCRVYWEPVEQFARSIGWRKEDAEDVTQKFFVYLMERRIVQEADQEMGTFRSFLKTVFRRFLSDELDRRNAQKRGGGMVHMQLDSPEVELAEEGEVGVEFDRAWARAAMNAALQQVMNDCESGRGKEAAGVLKPFLGGEGEMLTYEVAADRMGLSLSAFKSEVFEWRKRLRESLRSEVRRTVSAPHEFDQEFSYLRQLLAG